MDHAQRGRIGQIGAQRAPGDMIIARQP
jgi:hypothetical protein